VSLQGDFDETHCCGARPLRVVRASRAKLQPLTDCDHPRSHVRLDRLIHRPTAIGPVLEGAEIVDLGIAHILEHLATERRSPAGRAIENDRLVLGEILVMVGCLGIRGDELRALRKLQKEQEPKSAFVFTSERGGAPFSRDSFNWMVKRAGKKAKLPFQVHPHMIRHATGYKLANAGKDTRSIQGYLGHKDIRHTVRYTELSPTRFKNFWPD